MKFGMCVDFCGLGVWVSLGVVVVSEVGVCDGVWGVIGVGVGAGVVVWVGVGDGGVVNV